MSIIKLFLPNELYNEQSFGDRKILYGDIVQNAISKNISIYVLCAETNPKSNGLKNIGFLSSAQISNASNNYVILSSNRRISPKYPHILIDRCHLIELLNHDNISTHQFHVMLYDFDGFNSLSRNNDSSALSQTSIANGVDIDLNSIQHLTQLLQKNYRKQNGRNQLRSKTYFYNWIVTRLYTLHAIFLAKWAPLLRPIANLFGESAIYQHFSIWSECIRCYSFRSGKAWTIIIDVVAGMILMISLLHMVDPGKHLIEFTEIMVSYLRQLLHSLKGSPVGFKLNIELNHFFLDCFSYHVDLWGIFLELISPAIKYLFMPLAVLGCFGISFQLAMLSDLLVLTTLHATCFYIYAAVLYHIQIVGLLALWRVVLGRRKNILKGRVESYDYTNSQLYLSTMIFTGLLFLLPTVLIYYVVFASLRFCLFCITYALMVIRKKILVLPVYAISRWIFGCHMKPNIIEIAILDVLNIKLADNRTQTAPLFHIKPAKCSFPSWIDESTTIIKTDGTQSKDAKDKITDKGLTQHSLNIKQFLFALLKSDIMGFKQPK